MGKDILKIIAKKLMSYKLVRNISNKWGARSVIVDIIHCNINKSRIGSKGIKNEMNFKELVH